MPGISLYKLWGELPADINEEYRNYYFKQDVRQARTTMIIMLIPILSSGLIDYALLGFSFPLLLSIMGRCAFMAYTIFMIIYLEKVRSIKQYDFSVFIWLLVGAVFINIGGALRPATYSGHTIVFVVMLVILYFGVPNRLTYWLINGVVFTCGILLNMLFFKNPGGPMELETLLALLIVTFGCVFITHRIYSYKRNHFLAYHQISRLAAIDNLTGILNRRVFLEYAEQEMIRFQRYGKHFCLLITDMDEFKKINDKCGHVEGDGVLKQYAILVNSEVRNTDIFGRIGGEEFCLLLPETSREEAVELAGRISRKCRSIDIRAANGDNIKFSISTGVAEVEKSDSSIDQVISRADTALYKAKHEGRDRIAVVATNREL